LFGRDMNVSHTQINIPIKRVMVVVDM